MYVATVNTPGYLPMDDEPATFETAHEAWAYLAEEYQRALDYSEGELSSEEDHAFRDLSIRARGYESEQPDSENVGTVYVPTPGYGGDHDLGLAYSVEEVEEEAGRMHTCDGSGYCWHHGYACRW